MSMRTVARRATTALLCAVVLAALGLAFVGLPAAEAAPESLRVSLDFDTFQPGVTQSRTSDVDIPVPSRVTAAEIEQTGGVGDAIDVALTICAQASNHCEPLVAGLELEAGPHRLTVDATLVDELPPGIDTALAGQIRIVESRSSTTVDTTTLLTIAGVGLLAIAGAMLVAGPRHGVAS